MYVSIDPYLVHETFKYVILGKPDLKIYFVIMRKM